MRDDDKPYLCVRNGWAVQITPRNREGWRGLAAWLLALMLLTGLFVGVISSGPGHWAIAAITAIFLIVTAGWTILMIRWMMARSLMVDAEDLARYKRDQRRKGN